MTYQLIEMREGVKTSVRVIPGLPGALEEAADMVHTALGSAKTLEALHQADALYNVLAVFACSCGGAWGLRLIVAPGHVLLIMPFTRKPLVQSPEAWQAGYDAAARGEALAPGSDWAFASGYIEGRAQR